jgi:amino acid adenylation domain-containing protein
MSGRLLHQYLENTAARYPQKTAVLCGGQSITYGDLKEKSDRLARRILSIGMEKSAPVGIYLDKSIEAVVAMFAVLKAGCAYIPLDSQYSPVSRVVSILKASGLRLIISDSAHVRALEQALEKDPGPCLEQAILTDTLLASEINPNRIPLGSQIPDSAERVKNGPIRVSPYIDSAADAPIHYPDTAETDLAYVLYTSGSTGTPKGVMLSHLNAGTFIDWALGEFRPNGSDRFSNIAPLHFDLSVFDIHVAIACGATVHLVPAGTAANPRALLSWIRESGITFFYSVPSVWTTIMNYAGLKRGDLPGLTHILFAGEVFPHKGLSSLMGLVPQAAFYNLYGPTETNVCTFYRVRDAAEAAAGTIPIGKACAGTEVVAIGENGKEVSAGETGELLVRGPIVTSGYYQDPRLSSAAFAESPLPRHNGALLYRTGDLVRLGASGDYEYLGRRDLMVKLAGFRIELPEVEQALLRNPSVSEAVVVPVFNGDRLNAKSLTAFITPRSGLKPGVVAVKEFLAGLLPRYMIPEGIVFLDRIPRNGNGKADRMKLAELAELAVEKGIYGN